MGQEEFPPGKAADAIVRAVSDLPIVEDFKPRVLLEAGMYLERISKLDPKRDAGKIRKECDSISEFVKHYSGEKSQGQTLVGAICDAADTIRMSKAASRT
jgi:hypothetical protein